MFEKLPAATMNNRGNSSTERLISAVRKRRGKPALHEELKHFPSYLPLFDNFFGPLISDLQWGAAPFLAGCCGRFPTAQAHVSFL
jgi:hypothetical protein